MSATHRDSVDMRGFSWRLAPLQRKLEWELEAARGALARCVQEQVHATTALHEMEAQRAKQADCVTRSLQAQPDPDAHRQALVYLVQEAERIFAAGEECRQAEAQVAAARDECVLAQRRLDTLMAVRDKAADDYVRWMLQRQASEADAAWLLKVLRLRGATERAI